MEATRQDRGIISKSESTDEGYLRVWMTVSRTGELEYRNDDGSVRSEYVSEETLMDKTSLDTAWGKPITLGHPEIGLLDSTNTKDYQRGLTQQGMVINDGFLTVVGVITDKEAIDAVNSGTNQVSAGYKTVVKPRTDGKFEQTARKYNHFAIVPQGRAGQDVKVHLDCYRCDAVGYGVEDIKNDIGGTMGQLATIHLDGVGYEVESSVASAIKLDQKRLDTDIKNLKTRNDELTTRKDELEEQVTTLQSEVDKAKGELEATKLKLQEAEKMDGLNTEISARMDAWTVVLPSIKSVDQEFKADYGQSVADIQRTYLAKVHNRTDLAEKSDAYVEGLYEALQPNVKMDAKAKTSQALQELNRADSRYKKTATNDELSNRRKNRPLPGLSTQGV